jgi:hypothetical protein
MQEQDNNRIQGFQDVGVLWKNVCQYLVILDNLSMKNANLRPILLIEL